MRRQMQCSRSGRPLQSVREAQEKGGGEGSVIELTGERLADSRKGELGGTWERNFGVEVVGRTTCRWLAALLNNEIRSAL